MELVVHAATAPQFWQPELVLLMLYPLVPAVLLFALCRLFPPRANRVLGPVCSGLCYIFFASQLVYYSIFHCFYSAYSMGNGGQVMQFWKVTLHAIRKNWLPLSLMLLPPWATPCSESAFRRRGCAFPMRPLLRRLPSPCISA